MWDRDFSGSAQLSNGTSINASYTRKQERLGGHVVLLIDVSGSMSDDTLWSVTREIDLIMGCLNKGDSVTLWLFDADVTKVDHFKVRRYNYAEMASRLMDLDDRSRGNTKLFDAVVEAMEDFEQHARGNEIARFFVVLSDGGDNDSKSSAYDAKRALERCQVNNFYPILISAGRENAFEHMPASNATMISVGSTSSEDMRTAFEEARKQIVAQLSVTVTSGDGKNAATTTFQTRGSSEHVRNLMHDTLARALEGSLSLVGAGQSSLD